MQGRLSNKQADGFTIVELLIVVVVIAILAAITVVSFNGITKNAKASAAQASAKQAATKLSMYFVENNTYPSALSDIGINSSADANYQYRLYDSGKKYCVTATSQSTSYYIDNDGHTTPTVGACPSHGIDGVAAVTNLAIHTGAEDAGYIYKLVQMGGTGRDSSVTRVNTWSDSGSWSLEVKKTLTENIPKGIRANIDESAVPGDVIRWSAVVKNNTPNTRTFNAYGERGSPSVYAAIADDSGVVVSIPAGEVRRVSGVATITAANSGSNLGFGVVPSVSYYPVGQSYFIDSFIVTKNQPLPAFADGDSPGWVWNGTRNNSTSTGPAL